MFPIRMILAIFDLQITLILPPSLASIGLSIKDMKCKIDNQDGDYLGFPIRMFLAFFFFFFIYKSSPCFPPSFKSINPMV